MQLRINGEMKQFAALATVAELVQALELVGKRVAVELNGEIVPRSQHGLAALADGDELEIVVAVGGG
ncbi:MULTISPECIES: sulfur carrier protein ThiS [Aquitalea]|jgi:sulfur carrier protein|uniref:Sulfur carrier protein ThiS n=2 Tax=Aquitalea TaxID=407217 RepID=A0A454JEK8_9NEIS|nr:MULTISPECIES: sulfur carrier protein ThiS [Aquitalea]MBA4709059.1 sulfur carrier protein ThiS [Aquitalea magnusonii]RMC93510.1 sulfur carrier protein ThiS [Aquitalea palustris]